MAAWITEGVLDDHSTWHFNASAPDVEQITCASWSFVDGRRLNLDGNHGCLNSDRGGSLNFGDHGLEWLEHYLGEVGISSKREQRRHHYAESSGELKGRTDRQGPHHCRPIHSHQGEDSG